MRSYVFLFLAVAFLFSCKKESGVTDAFNGKININVKNHDITLELKKQAFTDSVIVKFSNDIVYDCNLYKINYAHEFQANDHSFVLGNVYYIPGFCVLGNFPAIAAPEIKDWANGSYQLNVTKNENLYTGKLIVTNAAYTFDWQHDHILKITNKVINK